MNNKNKNLTLTAIHWLQNFVRIGTLTYSWQIHFFLMMSERDLTDVDFHPDTPLFSENFFYFTLSKHPWCSLPLSLCLIVLRTHSPFDNPYVTSSAGGIYQRVHLHWFDRLRSDLCFEFSNLQKGLKCCLQHAIQLYDAFQLVNCGPKKSSTNKYSGEYSKFCSKKDGISKNDQSSQVK